MRWIHTADVHLGAQPDMGCPWSAQRKQEIWDTFHRLIQRVKTEDIDLLLVAGDLFHRQPLKSELKEVDYLFSTIPDTKVVFLAGNHDYLRKDSYYRNFRWGENVTFLDGRDVKQVYLKELNTYVYGLSYQEREIREACYDKVRPGSQKGIHILLAHGGDEKHIPMNMERLAASGFDYIAMGHIHKPHIYANGKMAYAGALEPIDRNDFGEHGFVQGETTETTHRIKWVPFASREYLFLEIPCSQEMSQHRLEDEIAKAMEEMGTEHTYAISLVGTRQADLNYQKERIQRLGRIVEVEDHTEPALDLEEIHRKYDGTILGEYVEQFPRDAQGISLKALNYGIWALLQTKR